MSNTDEVITALEEIYVDLKKVRRELRPDDLIAEELGIDSLGALDMLVALEDRYDIRLVDDTRVAGVRTVGGLADLIVAATAAKA